MPTALAQAREMIDSSLGARTPRELAERSA
jgi:hypothetical protein